jgi:hypothetical protein
MSNTLKRGLIACAAITSLATALLLSGGAAQAQTMHRYLTIGPSTVVLDGGVVLGQDPDANVRLRIRRDFGNQDR